MDALLHDVLLRDVLLHNESPTHTGTFEIRRTVTVNISAEEARRQVHRWLLLNVSHMMGAEVPTLIVGDKSCWRVPVHLSTPQSGIVGQVGTVDVDAVTAELLDLSHQKASLEQRARSLMTTEPSFQPKKYSLLQNTSAPQVPPARKIILDEYDQPIVIPTL